MPGAAEEPPAREMVWAERRTSCWWADVLSTGNTSSIKETPTSQLKEGAHGASAGTAMNTGLPRAAEQLLLPSLEKLPFQRR